MPSPTTLVAIAALILATPALAQPKGEPQSSNMSPPSGNSGAGNNGIGTAGSHTGNNGTASSTINPGNSSLAASPKPPNPPKGGALENDPAMGGGSQK